MASEASRESLTGGQRSRQGDAHVAVRPEQQVRFAKSMSDLQSVNNDRSTETNFANLIEMGGVQALAEGLCTDLRRGLSGAEAETGFADRRALYPGSRTARQPCFSRPGPRAGPPGRR